MYKYSVYNERIGQNCGKTIAKYVILDIVEFLDDDNKINTNNEDFEKVMNYTNTKLSMNCWLEANERFVILHEIIKRP